MAYFPNGTSGMMYEEKYCDRCVNSEIENGCPVMNAHLRFAYGAEGEAKAILDELIPMDGLYADKCSMFRKRGSEKQTLEKCKLCKRKVDEIISIKFDGNEFNVCRSCRDYLETSYKVDCIEELKDE